MASETQILSRLIKHAKNDKDPLTPLIDRYFLEREDSPTRCTIFDVSVLDRLRPAGRLSPSSICGCQRQAVFKFVGMEGRRKTDPETEAILDDGKWRHLRLDWQLLDMEAVLGPDVFKVISIEESVGFPKLFIAGSLDIVVRIHGLLYVIDFKGINGWGFEHVFKSNEPKVEHVLQLISYCRLRRIKRGLVYYENKNDNRTKIFPVRWTADSWTQVEEWCDEVLEHLELQRLPPMHPDCRDGRYLYNRCPFSRHCYGQQTAAQVERVTFRGFPGISQLWEAGNDLTSER